MAKLRAPFSCIMNRVTSFVCKVENKIMSDFPVLKWNNIRIIKDKDRIQKYFLSYFTSIAQGRPYFTRNIYVNEEGLV